ncbi:MAG: hypothetical protein HN420_07740, partial [Rhodospirillaceae bacterium]|nr:hypothetical protein [Rhodospirillaceae bacterium]
MASTLDNIEIRTLSAPDAGAFGKFTFPLLRHLVEDPPERDMVYIGAMTKTGEPVGLA